MWQSPDCIRTCCNVVFVLYTRVDLREKCQMVQRTPSGKNKVYVCSISSKVTFASSWWHGKEVKKGRNDQKRLVMHVSKWQTSRSLWLYIHQSARCVGRNFCGYLILRFFPNRKNSQNIVPANNSNIKVAWLVSSRSVHHGIFPDFYFYTLSLQRPHERRPMASRRELVSALFFVAWTQRRLTECFPWATEGPNPPKETLTFKKEFFWQTTSGSLPAGLKGEVYSEMKLSQSVELFLTKRMPPIRNPSDVWFSGCASWKSAATPPRFGRDTPFWRHWHSDWLARDREKVVFRTFRKIWAFSSRFVPRGFFRTILRV